MEMKYYRDVLLPQVESGDIIYYELQKPYELQPKFIYNDKKVQPIKYVADFFIRYSDGKEEVIDIKGMADNVANLKKKMFWYAFPNINYYWICFSKTDGGWCNYEYIKKQRVIRKKKKENQ